MYLEYKTHNRNECKNENCKSLVTQNLNVGTSEN